MAKKKKEEELSEEDFIQESYSRDPFPLWASILAFVLMCFAIYSFSAWVGKGVQEKEPVQIEEQNPS